MENILNYLQLNFCTQARGNKDNPCKQLNHSSVFENTQTTTSVLYRNIHNTEYA